MKRWLLAITALLGLVSLSSADYVLIKMDLHKFYPVGNPGDQGGKPGEPGAQPTPMPGDGGFMPGYPMGNPMPGGTPPTGYPPTPPPGGEAPPPRTPPMPGEGDPSLGEYEPEFTPLWVYAVV